MEPSKKATKKTFSVPSAKGKTGGTGDATPQDQASSLQAGNDTGGKGGKKDSVKKIDKPHSNTAKTGKKTDKPHSDTAKTGKKTDKPHSDAAKTGKKTDKPHSDAAKTGKKTSTTTTTTSSKRTFLPKKPAPRSLTDLEYEDIFLAVLENFSGTPEKEEDEEEENVGMRPDQTEKESPVKNAETTCAEKHGCGDEENSYLDHSDKENGSRNKSAAENANDDNDADDDDDRLVEDGEEKNEAEYSDSKPCDDKDNSRTKTSNDDPDEKAVTTVPESKRPKKKDKQEKEAPKKEKKKKCTQDEKVEKEGKVKPKKTKNSSKDPQKRKHEEDVGAEAKNKKKKKKTAPTHTTSKPKQSEMEEASSKDADKDHGSNKTLTTSADCCDEKSKKKSADLKKQETKPKKKQKEKHREENSKPSKKKNKGGETENEKTENTEQEKDETDRHHGKNSECEVNKTSLKNEEQAEENIEDCEHQTESDSEKNETCPTDEEKEAEARSSEEREEKDDDEKDEAESVGSEQSLGSSLLGLAHGVDQWDRLEEIKDQNEHTPCVNELEGKPTVTHKLKRKKPRENQLAPRKLSFEGAAGSKKKRQALQCSESEEEDASSIPAELGTWVQCEDRGCQKWRYLADIHDPTELPARWVCAMNTDERYNSCTTPQQEYDESDHIFTQFTLGSLVWAKMDGFPWWPAMVDSDPDCDVYCQIPHEDSMVPVEYHVVFLDKSVTRSWIRQSRLQALAPDHLGPASIFLKGHRYKKDMQEAMRRAEAALHMPLQDRVKQFGFAACFRNASTRWTKAEAKPSKRKASAPSQRNSAMPGPVSAKKRRKTTGRQLRTNDSDSDSHASGSPTSLDSDLPSPSSTSDEGGDDDDSDDDNDTRRRFLARQKWKGEREGRKGLIALCGNKAVDRKQAARKRPGKPASKKKLKATSGALCAASLSPRCVPAKARHAEPEDSSSTDSDSDAAPDESSRKKPGKPLKRKKTKKTKIQSATKLDTASSDKENRHRKNPAWKPEDNNAEEEGGGGKRGKKKSTEAKKEKDGASSGKVKVAGKGCKLQGWVADRTHRTTAWLKPDREALPTSSPHHPSKKQKRCKSEMTKTKKDGGTPHLQPAGGKQTDKASMEEEEEDKKPKVKCQKFVAPVKPVSEASHSKLKTSATTHTEDGSPLGKETVDKPEVKQPPHKETVDRPEVKQQQPPHKETVDKPEVKQPKKTESEDTDFKPEDCEETPERPASLWPNPSTRTLSPATQPQHPDLSPPRSSSPLSPSYKDQFVPSLDNASDDDDNNDDDDDSDKLDFGDDDAAERLWRKKKKRSEGEEPSFEEGGGKKGEEVGRESDSDCLDLEEELPIPSLQGVLKVPSKGCSDHDSVASDPLEMAED